MRYVCVVLGCLSLTACAGWETVQGTVAGKGAQAADEFLQSGEWVVCEAATVGAVNRKYGLDPAKTQAWKDYCKKPVIGESVK